MKPTIPIHHEFLPIEPSHARRPNSDKTVPIKYVHPFIEGLFANDTWYYNASSDKFIHPSLIEDYLKKFSALRKAHEGNKALDKEAREIAEARNKHFHND